MRKTVEAILDEKLAKMAEREGYGGAEGKPSFIAEVVAYDVDIERGFTSVIIEARVRNFKSGRMGRKSELVVGYAKRNNRAGDAQNDEIGLGKALRDAARRALGLSRQEIPE